MKRLGEWLKKKDEKKEGNELLRGKERGNK